MVTNWQREARRFAPGLTTLVHQGPGRLKHDDFVKKSGGLDYAESRMLGFRDQALEVLRSYPESPYRESLELMVNYVVDRKI
mgnify:CR=1 FL=1